MINNVLMHHSLYAALKDKPGVQFYLNELKGSVVAPNNEPVLYDVEHAVDSHGTHYLLPAFRNFDRSISVKVIELTKDILNKIAINLNGEGGVILDLNGIKIKVESDLAVTAFAVIEKEGYGSHQLESMSAINLYSPGLQVDLYHQEYSLLIHDDAMYRRFGCGENSVDPYSKGESALLACEHYRSNRRKDC